MYILFLIQLYALFNYIQFSYKEQTYRYKHHNKTIKLMLYALFIHRSILNLPHSSSIRHWHSSINAEPGFHKEIISFLKNLPSEDKDCNMIFDSILIRQQLLWNEQERKFVGHVNYGNDIYIEESDTLANEALVFMLVALNSKWKWPTGYFLKKSLSGTILAELILTLTSDSELKVRSITCDGANVNISALNKLGCNIYVNNYDSIVNSFKHPIRDYNVYVILDRGPIHAQSAYKHRLSLFTI